MLSISQKILESLTSFTKGSYLDNETRYSGHGCRSKMCNIMIKFFLGTSLLTASLFSPL